jgi:X-Pro dipeptidyl-peptidase-like protein
MSRTRVAVLAVVVAGLVWPTAGEAAVKPFGKIDCTPQEGVRFCPGSIDKRIKTFDTVPLDVNVTLPATGNGPFPLVIQLHGWGGSKSGLGASKPWALKGYAVLNYSARGFGDSCGSEASRQADPDGCERGWVHLADQRYEVRDSQTLAGYLADQGLVHPQKIAATGGSYGGGQSLQLATLRDEVRLRDGTFVPWESPRRGLPMRIAAAAPIIPWSDLAYSLQPNGRTLDYTIPDENDDFTPGGVNKQSYVAGLFALGQATGFYAPPGVDPSADLRTWFAVIQAGEPYGEEARTIARKLAAFHSGYYLRREHRTAPILIANGFTDDLFPVNEAVRYVNNHPNARIAQLHFDFGHARGQGKAADNARLQTRLDEWFDRFVKGDTSVTPLSGVEAMTQTCPSSAPSGGPFRAPTWDALSPGEVRFSEGAAKTALSGSDSLGQQVDPIGGGGACVTPSASDQGGTATYRLPAATGDGYTLLGSPTVIANLAINPGVEPQNTELAARLWDVAPDNTQTLAARGVFRPSASGRVVFQLFPGAWKFEAGHVAKLELLGRDSPYLRASNFPFSIGVSNLQLRLPTHDAADGGQVKQPLAPVLPPGAKPAP